MNTSKEIKFLAIGDTVVDAFIRLINAEEVLNIDRHTRQLCMTFGDKIPFEFAEVISGVGNSANAAVAVARLGLHSGLLSNIGDDLYGKDCIEQFKKNGVDTTFIKTNEGKVTNYHYVLWYHNERTILIKHEEYEYTLPDIGTPEWIYLSSLSQNSLPFHKLLENYMEKNPQVKLVFQPGTFQIKLGVESLRSIYKHAHVFFCNVEEAELILTSAAVALAEEEKTIGQLLLSIAELGPKIVVITDGPKGAYAFDSITKKTWFMPPYPDPKEPYERTGAGDAFASTFTGALLLNKSIPDALAWGAINSMSVVQFTGAQKGLLTQEKLEEYLKNKPASFVAKEV